MAAARDPALHIRVVKPTRLFVHDATHMVEAAKHARHVAGGGLRQCRRCGVGGRIAVEVDDRKTLAPAQHLPHVQIAMNALDGRADHIGERRERGHHPR